MIRHAKRQSRRLFCVAALCVSLAPVAGASGSGQNILTNAAQVRSLSREEAANHPPVLLRGVVIGEAEAGGDGFAIQDETSGLYFRGSPEVVSRLRPGDLVEVEGVSDPGEFAPFVQFQKVRKLGSAELPPPRRVTFDELATGELDAQWAEITGIVRYYGPSLPDTRKCRLELVVGGGRLVVRINRPYDDQPLVDARVTVRGVCYHLVNRNRQTVSPLLSVPHDVPLEVEVPAPAHPFATPVQAIESLMQFTPGGATGHRVHVRGVVTFRQTGGSLWIQEGALGLQVRTAQAGELKPGDEVDVLGFARHGDYSPMLEDAVFQVRSSGPAPQPIRLEEGAEAFDHDAALVQIEGTITERQLALNGWNLTLAAKDQTVFKASLRRTPGAATIDSRPGGRVRVSGICSVVRSPDEDSSSDSGLLVPHSFQLLLRSPTDFAVIVPAPWWTRERFLWLLAGITGASLLVAGGVLLMARWHVREQAARRATAEAELSAILNERNRVAREIHDTLAQGLGAISMQLELARDKISPQPDGVGTHLEIAHRLVRSSLAEARRSIWNMRSQVLETGDLAAALEGILRQLANGTRVTPDLKVTGPRRRLPPVMENNLLRIGQEAITNAFKHSGATRVSVALQFFDSSIALRVKDDGRGFDPDAANLKDGSLGMTAMRERATLLHGQLQIQSKPGSGAEIILEVPTPVESKSH